MIIFDTKNNNSGKAKGTLYLSLMDAEYLLNKYTKETLEEKIPLDYLNYFIETIEERKNEDTFSIEHYAILTLGIDNDEDKAILELLKSERDVLFTKSELSNTNIEEIKKMLNEAKMQTNYPDNLPLEELYRIRSYEMAIFIDEKIKIMNECVKKLYETNGYNRGSYNRYQETEAMLLAMGLSKDIYESDYFLSTPLKKTNI